MQQIHTDSISYMDCHTHLLDYPSNQQIQETVSHAVQNGVNKIVVNTTTTKQFEQLNNLCEIFGDFIVAGYGIHPCYVTQQQSLNMDKNVGDLNENENKGWIPRLNSMLQKNELITVGEIGLDYRTLVLQKNSKELQMEYFKIQLQIAIKFDRPVTIHCIRAHGEMYKILKQMNKQIIGQRKPNLIMHSYGGSKQITKSLLKLLNMNIYFCLSLNRNVELCNVIPIDKLLCQTDAPYQNNRGLLQELGMLDMNRYFVKVKQSLMKECVMQKDQEGLGQDGLGQRLSKMQTNQPVNMIANVRSLCKYYKIDESQFVRKIYQNSINAFKIKEK